MTIGAVGLTSRGTFDPQSAPEGFDPQINQGAVFSSKPNIPDFVTPGQTMTVTAGLGYDCTTCPSGNDIRLRATGPAINQPILSEERELSGFAKETKTFAVDIPVQGQPGEEYILNLQAQSGPTALSGWSTNDEEGPLRIPIVSEEEAQRKSIAAIVPFVALGGGLGFAAANFEGRKPMPATVGGAVAGGGLKFVTDAGLLNTGPIFPTREVAVTAAALGAGALLVAQFR